ncbi:MAG: DUF559 domain-containing protein [Nitrospiria bacterium]
MRRKKKSLFSDTSIEVLLQAELKKRKIKYETQKKVTGLPDIFINPNICVFADGNYWHANPEFYKASDMIKHAHEMWTASRKWAHDKYVTDELTKEGYVVIRFWETDIKNSVSDCVDKIVKVINTSSIITEEE